MTKPSQRHSSHVQSDKPAQADESKAAQPAPTPETPTVQSNKQDRLLWLALVLWTLVFGFLLAYMFLTDIIYFFRT